MVFFHTVNLLWIFLHTFFLSFQRLGAPLHIVSQQDKQAGEPGPVFTKQA